MPRHDPDVIAALAEGRLDPEEAAVLEREISSDAVAVAALAAHRTSLAATSDAARPELTIAERSDLHAAVADAIGISDSAAVTESERARRVPWGSLGIAAAALAGLVAIVPVVGLLSTGGADTATSLDLGALAPVSTAQADTQTFAASDESAESVVAEGDVDDGLVAGESAGADAAAFGSSTTVLRSTATPAAPTPTAPALTDATGSSESTTTTSEAAEIPAEVEELAAELEAIRSDPLDVLALSDEAFEENSCWTEDTDIRADPPPQRYTFEYQNGELTVIVYFELDEGEELGPFQVWGVPDCANLVVVP